MAKQNVVKMITPPAVGAYVWLNKPDTEMKFSDGKFKVTLKIDKKGAPHKKFMKELEKLSLEIAESIQASEEHPDHKEWKGLDLENMKYPHRDGDATDKEDFKGFWTLCAKTKFRPGMFDCSDPVQSLPEGEEPRSGDSMRLAVALNPYCMGKGNFGISAQLRNVQLIERNNTGSGQDDAFEAVEGGFKTNSTKPDIISDDEDDF